MNRNKMSEAEIDSETAEGIDSDTEVNSSDEEVIYQEGWAWLPDLLLERILAQLTHRQRYYCSMVCRHWYDVAKSPRVWRKMEVGERTFTYKRFNLYKGYQHEISHHRVQMCLGKIGNHIQVMEILPITNFFNLYEFMNMFSCFMEFFDEFPMPGLRSFKFTFACESRGAAGPLVHGTGGMLLQQLKRLLGNLRPIERLTLNNLLLSPKDFIRLLDDFSEKSMEELKYMEILNITNRQYPFTYAGQFVNLEKLIITPNQLNSDVVLSIANNTKLRDLELRQDDYLNNEDVEPIPFHVWYDVKEAAPQLRVSIVVRAREMKEIVVQEGAPVYRVIFDCPMSKARDDIALTISDEYSKHLRVYAHLGLPRVHGPRSFDSRGDSSFALLLAACQKLETLVINQRISTATLLVLACKETKLKRLCVRRNAVMLKCDWPSRVECYDHFRFKDICKSYEKTEQEMRRLLKIPLWKMLSDAEFKSVCA